MLLKRYRAGISKLNEAEEEMVGQNRTWAYRNERKMESQVRNRKSIDYVYGKVQSEAERTNGMQGEKVISDRAKRDRSTGTGHESQTPNSKV